MDYPQTTGLGFIGSAGNAAQCSEHPLYQQLREYVAVIDEFHAACINATTALQRREKAELNIRDWNQRMTQMIQQASVDPSGPQPLPDAPSPEIGQMGLKQQRRW